MKRWHVVLLLIVLASFAGAGWWLFTGTRSAPVAPVSAPILDQDRLRDPALIAEGEYLVTVGDCVACHTARGGARFAGGRSLSTPFGSFPAPNITPDPETGLGEWSFEDFRRAMKSGKGRHGELLYPAFPFTSYTRVTDKDTLAMFAYLQSLAPVHQANKALALRFPYSVRQSLVAWRALYFREGTYQPDPEQSDQWNRGAYLVQGLGHCNECHMTRDALGGVPKNISLAGGEIPAQHWYASDLSTQTNGGLEGWSEQDIVDLLQTGTSARGGALGPMAEVVERSTQHLRESDLRAIAIYLQSLPPRPVPQMSGAVASQARLARGSTIYTKDCASCHGDSGKGIAHVYPPLDGNVSVIDPTGINASRAVLMGGFSQLTAGNPRPYSMPPFMERLNDQEIADVVSYIRQAWSNKASAVEPEDVSTYRHLPMVD